MSDEEQSDFIDKNKEENCAESTSNLVQYDTTIAQDAERKQEISNIEQNITSKEFHRQDGGMENYPEFKMNRNDKIVDSNSSVCVDINLKSDNILNSNIDNSIEQIIRIERQTEQNDDDCPLFTSSLPINCIAVENRVVLPVDNYSERDCKSDADILETNEEHFGGDNNIRDDTIIVASSSNLVRPHKVRHRRVLRSRSWCVRTRNNSLNTTDIRMLRDRLLRTQSRPQPSALRGFTIQQKMTLVSLALVDFMSFCSMSIMAPFFPREANEKGMTDSVSGFVFSFYALVMFITSPIFGKILPSVGAKFMLMSGMFVAGFCNLLFGVLEYIIDYETFTTYCFLIRGFEALGASAYSMASHVYVVNTFPNNIGTVLGVLETFIGLGMSVGPAIGGLLYSVGGFGLPFYVLGIAMVLCMPVNYFLLPVQTDYSVPHNTGSLFEVIKIPAVVITSIIIVVMSNTWAFLDPTLEPHLRQFDLDAHQVGLIFLLFSALYGISSPFWGWLADRIHNHWCMMACGLVFSSVGLLLLGPSPLLPFLKSSLWLNLVGLSILGISVALTLLPTFQGVLTSSIEEGGCSENIATYSMVAGVWSCMYSLGEVIGPSLGGVLLKSYGFPVLSTVMASFTFVMAIITFVFFSCRTNKQSDGSESSSNESKTDGAWQTLSGPRAEESCSSPGLTDDGAGVGSDENDCLLDSTGSNIKNGRQSYGGTGITSQEIQDFVRNQKTYNDYQNAQRGTDVNLKNLSQLSQDGQEVWDENHNRSKMSTQGLKALIQSEYYQKYLDESLNAIVNMQNNLKSEQKRDNLNEGNDSFLDDDQHSDEAKNSTQDFIFYSQEKVKYYKQSRILDRECQVVDRNELTDVRGTVNITSSGACEV